MNPSLTSNPPVATPFFFYGLAAIMIIGGILVITRKNAVHSALALITTLLAQAALYLMLYAPFVAGVQIILYAGGIMVLFLFVIMLISIERAEKERQFNKQWLVGIAAAAALGGLFITVYTTTTKGRVLFPEGRTSYVDMQNTQGIANLLFDQHVGTYMFAFEIASLLLLVAIIGAVVMAKKRI
jgi:NADH-quinone oxidoreductase subunit J